MADPENKPPVGPNYTTSGTNAGQVDPPSNPDSVGTTLDPQVNTANPSEWFNFSDYWQDGRLKSPGVGALGAGVGALAGGLLPGKDTSLWKRLLYSLLGAGLLGGGSYLASNLWGDKDGQGFQILDPAAPPAAPPVADKADTALPLGVSV